MAGGDGSGEWGNVLRREEQLVRRFFLEGLGGVGVILVGGVDEWWFLIAGMASQEFGGQKNGKAHVKVRGQ